MLPIFRTTLLGAVCLTLALLAGFAAREPSRPQFTHAGLSARGPLIEAADHPEWKQFLVQAAFRRADELEKLRALPDTPVIVEEVPPPPPEPAPADDKIAALPQPNDAEVHEDITGSIDEKPAGTIPVEIGEASSLELPLAEEEVLPPVRQPETLQRLNDNQPKAQRKRVVRAKKKPPAKPAAQPAVSGILPAIFGERLSAPQ